MVDCELTHLARTPIDVTRARIQHAGIYQTGAATVRCMYAPAFAAHSASAAGTKQGCGRAAHPRAAASWRGFGPVRAPVPP